MLAQGQEGRRPDATLGQGMERKSLPPRRGGIWLLYLINRRVRSSLSRPDGAEGNKNDACSPRAALRLPWAIIIPSPRDGKPLGRSPWRW